jgi:nicotinamide-nucleotide amidase
MSLIEDVSHALRSRGLRMTSAESCTGGLISAAITDLAGSSEIFDRGFITYSNQSKIDLLGVYATTLEAFGAVSEQTAIAMVEGALRQTPADIAVSVTGVAGPGGGSPEKPVGLVYIGVGLKGQKAKAYKHNFSGDRASVRQQSVSAALTHILDLLKADIA